MSGDWLDILAEFNGRKMISLSESGTLPNADLMELYGIDWSYFSLWKDEFLGNFTAQQVQALLSDDSIVTEGELPMLPWSAVDYNHDGEENAADFVVWRKMNGQSGVLLADGDLSGQVNEADYLIWWENFGRAAFSASGSGESAVLKVPEPGVVLALVNLICCAAASRRRC
jgi:hypothetical protein